MQQRRRGPTRLRIVLSQQLRQLGDIRRDLPRLTDFDTCRGPLTLAGYLSRARWRPTFKASAAKISANPR